VVTGITRSALIFTIKVGLDGSNLRM